MNEHNAMLKKHLRDADTILLGIDMFKIFGIVSYALEKVIVEDSPFPKKLVEGGFNCNAWTDGYNMYFSAFGPTKLEEVVAVLIHEVLHIVSSHISRLGDHNMKLWNIATDHVVNAMIKRIEMDSKKIKLPDGCVYFKDIDEHMPEATAEDVYHYLLQNSSTAEIDEEGNIEITTPSGKKYKGKIIEGKNGDKCFEVVDENGNKMQGTIDCSPGQIKNGNKGDKNGEKQDVSMEEALDELKNKAKSAWTSGLLKGNTTGTIKAFFDKITAVEVPWQSILENAILYQCQMQTRRSWRNKHLYIRNAKVPGHVSKGNDGKHLVVVIDTSGSISDDDISEFLGIICSGMRFMNGLAVFVHDVEVHKELVIENRRPTITELRPIMEFTGRGGTSHEDAFTKIKEFSEDHDVSMVVFLTDFYSDVQNIWSKYNWTSDIPSAWVINETNGYTSAKTFFAQHKLATVAHLVNKTVNV